MALEEPAPAEVSQAKLALPAGYCTMPGDLLLNALIEPPLPSCTCWVE